MNSVFSEIESEIKKYESSKNNKNEILKNIMDIIEQDGSNLTIEGIKDLYGKTYGIPSYQRGYKWKEENVQKLLEDLSKFYENNKGDNIDYCLQPIIVRKIPSYSEKDKEIIEIIDGQQRLTTLLLILKLIVKNNGYIYNFEYETKSEKNVELTIEEFINSDNLVEKLEEIKNSETIDFYYLYNAVKKINLLEETNKNNIKELIEANRLKFLRYEIKEENKEEYEKPNIIFSRINDGKIPLTNAELSKALLLKLTNNQNREMFEFKQKEDAAKWDEMENAFENNEFWYFLLNKEERQQYDETRIDLIFTLYEKQIQKEKKERGEKIKVFDYIENQIAINEENKKIIWNKLKEIYDYLKEWYEDSELFHLIGYILCFTEKNKVVEKLTELLEDCKEERTKQAFREKLHELIKDDLKKEYKKLQKDDYKDSEPIKLKNILYDDNSKIIINKILLLFNVTSMIGTSNRISFLKFKEEKWNIEHIYPVHDGIDEDTKEGKEKRKELRKSVLSFKERFEKGEENEDETLKNAFERIKNKEIIEEKNIDEFKKQIDEIYNKLSKISKPKRENSIGNLVLLNESINKGYKNDLFIQKRKVIVNKILRNENEKKKGINKQKEYYILPCTERAFLKFYSKEIYQTEVWNDNDTKEYMEAIVKQLNKILKTKGNNKIFIYRVLRIRKSEKYLFFKVKGKNKNKLLRLKEKFNEK